LESEAVVRDTSTSLFWQRVDDGLYFHGTPDEVIVRAPEEVAEERAAREARAAEARAWEAFLARARAGKAHPDDADFFREVEDLALERREGSRVLRELGRAESPENAHALLLELGRWSPGFDPYPVRLKLPTDPPALARPPLPDEDRLDLTHLPAFAIDDEGCRDPDDALSLEGDRLWVHVADVAALVPSDSPIDLEARARGATLYLPEGAVPMLPPETVEFLGLGLAQVSPALSFGLDLTPKGRVTGMEVAPSWVRVTRLSYEQAESGLDEEPLRGFHRLAQTWEARRRERGAAFLEFPEVKVRVADGRVSIRSLPPFRSRALVREAMLAAGQAAARYALAREIPFPYTVQDFPGAEEQPQGLAEMHDLRRTLSSSQQRSTPAPHGGLGLEVYAQATSPLRRYLDLVVHQQLRAHLRGEPLLSAQELLERVGAADAVGGGVRRAERLAVRHWTLVYLMQHPDWRGEGVLIEKRGSRGKLLIPALDLETWVHLRHDVSLNSSVSLRLGEVNLPELEVHFRVVD
jgi:exoribonuclease-2